MNKTKVYVIEFDYWSFMGCTLSYRRAKDMAKHYLTTMREYEITGKIINNEIFVVLDDHDGWYGLFATEEEAGERVESHFDTNTKVYIKKIELLK